MASSESVRSHPSGHRPRKDDKRECKSCQDDKFTCACIEPVGGGDKCPCRQTAFDEGRPWPIDQEEWRERLRGFSIIVKI